MGLFGAITKIWPGLPRRVDYGSVFLDDLSCVRCNRTVELELDNGRGLGVVMSPKVGDKEVVAGNSA